MPVASLFLIVPSTIGMVFFISCLARPCLPAYNRRRFRIRIAACVTIAATAALTGLVMGGRSSQQYGVKNLSYNSQLWAVSSLFTSDYKRPENPNRIMAAFDQLEVTSLAPQTRHNVVVVVLEGVQYRYTSLSGAACGRELTPFLKRLAAQGVEFSNMRTTLPHTTKAIFALFSGRFPSASHDIIETIPAVKPYGGLATILADKLDYRTAFFQSAKGDFEARPGMVYNLGFQKFWSREDLDDPNSHVGYFGSDEFSMLKPVTKWIKSSDQPFFAVLLCSVTHDPYVVPEWFGTPSDEPIERYMQSISYTDKFLSSLDVELTKLGLDDETIFCVVGDHGEAFGEHGLLGHEMIAFDELLRIPFCLRAPILADAGKKIECPVSSVDLTPTILGLLGFDTASAGFDGIDALSDIPKDRKVYFSGWMSEGPAGYVQGNRKFVYHPTEKTTCLYNVKSDPLEKVRIELPEKRMLKLSEAILSWRTTTFFQPNQPSEGQQVVFDHWLCKWTESFASAKYKK